MTHFAELPTRSERRADTPWPEIHSSPFALSFLDPDLEETSLCINNGPFLGEICYLFLEVTW